MTYADVLKWDEFKHQRDKDGRFAATPTPRDIVQVYGLSAFPDDDPPETMDQIEARAYSMRRRSERLRLQQDRTRTEGPLSITAAQNAHRAKRREQHHQARLARMRRGGIGR